MSDLDSALRLRARAEDLARRHLPQVIERVFDALDVPDMRIELARLDLDLGTIAAGRLEEDAPAALERALLEALTEALREARHAVAPGRRAVPVSVGALEDFDTYLVHGAPRFRGGEGFDPAEAFGRLLDTQPDALVTMLRRRARDRHALDRLVLQLPEADLRALLALLAPADAELILTYQAELRRRYRSIEAPIPEPALRRTTWVLTLEFLLREPGTQFNRRAYAAHLLRGIAAEQGIAYSTLLALIRDALDQTRRRGPVAGSLPGVLDALIAEHEGVDRSGEPAAVAPAPPSDRDSGTLLRRFRDAADHPAALEVLVRQLTTPRFAALIEQLEPAHAALILTYFAGLTTLHDDAPLLALSHAGFERQLRLAVLRNLPRKAGSQFKRRSWLQLLLRRLAAVGGVSHAFLLESLTAALAVLRRRLPPEGALPAAVAELMADMPASGDPSSASNLNGLDALVSRLRHHRAEDPALTMLIRSMTAETFKAVVRKLQPRRAALLLNDIAALVALQDRHALAAFSAGAFETHLRMIAIRWLLRDPSPFRHADWAAHLSNELASAARIDPARFSMLVAHARDDGAMQEFRGDPATLAREIEDGGPGSTELLRRLARDPALLMRVTQTMRKDGIAAALARFGVAGAAAADDLALLANRHAQAALADLDAAAFQSLTAALAITALANGERFRRTNLRRQLLEGIARHQSQSVLEIGSWQQLERKPDPPLPSEMVRPDPLALAEQFLRAGTPSAHGSSLIQAATQNPSGFAALLRRLTVAASGETRSLIERLLAWMLPEEIVVALLPDSADHATDWAARLADMPGESMASAWTRVLDAVLRGEALDSTAPPAPGERHDRLALLRHWLEHGRLVWWTPPDTRIELLLACLAEAPAPELQRLFGDADADEVAVRLRRAADRLEAAVGIRLFEKLAPWAFAPAGPLATLSAGLAGSTLDDAQIRAVAAAIVGAPIDRRQLTKPLPIAKAGPEPERMPTAAPTDRAALFGWLSGSGAANPPRLAHWLRLLATLADRGDPALDAALRDALARPEARARWAAAMPEEIFARVIHRLAPARARFLLDTAAILAAAWRQMTPSAAGSATAATLRARLLAMLVEGNLPPPRVAVDRLIESLPGHPPQIAIRARAAELAHSGGYANVLAVLSQPPEEKPSRPPAAAADKTRLPEPQAGDHLYLANAGLVLFNPFLPRFFERIGVLTPDAQGVPRVTGIEAASRAVHMLQYLVDERCDAPEPELALNKLLSGVPVAAPIARAIELTDADRLLCDELTRAMIANWPIIRNTSPAGLRETFLQREGRLRREADHWTLNVQRKTLDVLVDQIPWSLALIYHRWMAEPVHVNW